MDHDTFAIISDWYHYAILELTHVKDFKSDTIWISKRLGITKSEANVAIERLLRVKLLVETPKGQWKEPEETQSLTHLKPMMTSEAAKKYQQQLLDRSKQAVQEIDVQLRSHTSAAFCFRQKDLKKAMARIQEFRRSFSEEFQNQLNALDVYQLQISFFPLTNPLSDKTNS